MTLINKISQIRSGRKVYSILYNRVKLSHQTSRLITKIIKTSVYPIESIARKLIYFYILLFSKSKTEVKNGYLIFPEKFDTNSTLYNDVMSIFNRYESFSDAKKTNKYGSSKIWRANLFQPEDLIDKPSILEFVTQDEIIEAVTKYLGSSPIIGDIQLWWSKENSDISSSQLYHIDQEDYKQLKLFAYFNNVTSDTGPLTFFDSEASALIKSRVDNPFNKIEDEEIDLSRGNHEAIEFTGEPGTYGLVDTSSCYHMGSRTRKGDRVAIMVSFLAHNCIREANKLVLHNEEIAKAVSKNSKSRWKKYLFNL